MNAMDGKMLGLNTMNEMVYPYLRLRKDFGRQPRFLKDHARVHCNIPSNKALRKKFRRLRLLEKGTNAVKPFAEDPMNTIRREKVEVGIMHSEGGWPKDISLEEPEMIARHRKKLEKDENYQVSMPIMFDKMDRFVKQNNAIDVYGELFNKKWKHRDTYRKTPSAKTVQIFRDWTLMQRGVKKIIWAPDNVGRIGVCHTPKKYDRSLRELPTEAYFWDIEIPSRPESLVRSGSHIMDIQYHPKDMHSLVGACFDGTVQFWDCRASPRPQAVSPIDISHGDVCSSAVWINSKTNTEFFSAGLDGQVIWWDIRNLEENLEVSWLDPEKGSVRPEAALGCTILEYEHTIPTKFLAGTEDGHIMVMMKKGKTPNDKLVNLYKGHRGSVLGLERNPTFLKNFLSVGETTVRVFAEDCRDSSIMWTAPQDCRYTHAAWIPSRPSVFVVTRNDGHFDVYDLIKDAARPYCKVKVKAASDRKKMNKKWKKERMGDPILTFIAPSDNPSQYCAVGSSKGAVYLQQLSESLYMSEKFDKPVLASCFEREARREKFIEQRFREIRLKKRDKEKQQALQESIEKEREVAREQMMAEAKAAGHEIVDVPDFTKNKKYDLAFEAKNDPRCVAERQFFLDLDKEMEEKGVDAWPEYKAMLEEQGKGQDDENFDAEAALDVTAADLANFVDDDEEAEGDKPPDDKKKSTDSTGAPAAKPAAPAPGTAPPPPDAGSAQPPAAPGTAPPPAATTTAPGGEAEGETEEEAGAKEGPPEAVQEPAAAEPEAEEAEAPPTAEEQEAPPAAEAEEAPSTAEEPAPPTTGESEIRPESAEAVDTEAEDGDNEEE